MHQSSSHTTGTVKASTVSLGLLCIPSILLAAPPGRYFDMDVAPGGGDDAVLVVGGLLAAFAGLCAAAEARRGNWAQAAGIAAITVVVAGGVAVFG